MRHAMGMEPMPWQQLVADVAGEVDPVTGLFRRSVVVVTVPRQCGKTTLVHGWSWLRCLSVADTRAAYTAQTHKDARDRFLDGLELIRRGALREHITPRLSSGSERLVFPNGSTDRLFAPLPDALHGSANDHVGVDEVFAFDLGRGQELEQAIIPTFTTRRLRAPGPQLWLFSTAGTDLSTWLRKWVDLGRGAVGDPSSPVAYFEWAAPEDADPYDESIWPDVHPGLGHTASYQALRDAAAVMSREEFGRAYLNLWSKSADRVIPAPAWAACQDPGAVCPTRGPVLAFDVAYDRSAAAVAVAAPRPDGRTHVEVIDARPGTHWVADRVDELRRRWRARVAADPAGPAGSIVAELQGRRVPLELVRAGAYAAACGGFFDAVLEGRVVHIGQAPLDDAAAAASRRPMGDAWAWGRKASAADISPLVAVTIAHALAGGAQPRAAVRSGGPPGGSAANRAGRDLAELILGHPR
jgi:hypothetical protein